MHLRFDQPLVEAFGFMYRAIQREKIGYSPHSRLTKPQRQVLVLQETGHRRGESLRIPRRHEQAADPVIDDFRIASHPGGDHGDTRSHGFEQGIRSALAQGREHGDRNFR